MLILKTIWFQSLDIRFFLKYASRNVIPIYKLIFCELFLVQELLSEIDKKEVEDSVVSEDHSLWGQTDLNDSSSPYELYDPSLSLCMCL